ncbi:MAG: glycosyltransferase family 1 protein [Caulobacteraceae bacterium]|nr:glycosyltransferase family 1 protein [Caulobacteraceae bacterium]
MSLSLNLAINTVSFGQISTLILRELFNSNKNINLLPIGNVDLSTQSDLTPEFGEWLQRSINDALSNHSRQNKIFKLWHLNGSFESYSDKQILLSFYELDQPTRVEINTVKNNHKVLFSSQETVDLYKNLGCKNVEYIPLAFDKYNFNKIDKTYFTDDRIVFNIVGKLEKRKHHAKLLQLWANKFGNNKKYALQCSIFNPFMKPEDQNTIISQALQGKSYFNINFLPFMGQNKIYNDYLNSANIIIGMSGGEGWGLPEFHSVAIGKHAIIMNAHGYKSWADECNSVLVEPNSKIEAYDGVFFHRGLPYNQGTIYDFNGDDFISACELAIKRVEKDRLNSSGLSLQEKFSSDKFTNNILKYLE